MQFPWRCRVARPPSSYPWETKEDEATYRAWEDDYQKASGSFSTCRLHKEFGKPGGHPAVQKVIDYHDAIAVDGSKPLA
ncbi:MAG: hypothetical protein JJU00_10435 [Opitutales bacterium]|nr:hypothetical protein [Opitutales bacterium]